LVQVLPFSVKGETPFHALTTKVMLYGLFLAALIALIPVGTHFVWGSLGIWLLVSGETLAGIGLLLWGGHWW
jgi:hypothetical protein